MNQACLPLSFGHNLSEKNQVPAEQTPKTRAIESWINKGL